MSGKRTRSTLERFWAKVDRRGADECWPWRGAANSHTGHGQFTVRSKPDRKLDMAYRVMWQLTYGAIPSGLNVCHRCDNPTCVNPAHLFLGTQADNLFDMRAKDRHARGERNGHAKLTPDDVLSIKQLVSRGQSQRAIARQFGVDQSMISHIVRGKHWAHLKGAA